MPDEFQVMAIEAFRGGASVFLLAKNGETDSSKFITATSTSHVVQEALLAAFFTRGKPSILFEVSGETTVIRRVEPFAVSEPPFQSPSAGTHRVARIATQRNQQGVDHLEVFIAKIGADGDTAYNVYDPLLAQILTQAFRPVYPNRAEGHPINIRVEDKTLLSVLLGGKPQNRPRQRKSSRTRAATHPR